jgi:hypothetical protein
VCGGAWDFVVIERRDVNNAMQCNRFTTSPDIMPMTVNHPYTGTFAFEQAALESLQNRKLPGSNCNKNGPFFPIKL